MRYKPFYFRMLLLVLPLLGGCNSKEPAADSTSYNPWVKSFTTGSISRFAPVYLIFAENVATEKIQETGLSKFFRIKPEVKGEFAFDDAHTVVFRPAASFERDTEYKITADLAPWFATEDKERYFSFRFSTYPLALHLEREAVNVGDAGGFDLVYTVRTPDKETPETLEPLIQASEKATTGWQHSPDGKLHTLSLKHVPARAEGYELILSAKPNKLGLKEGKLITTPIPAADDFSVYELRFVSEPERYVEVVFTEKLDEGQDLYGLAYIADNENETLTPEGNTLRLYPDKERTGLSEVFLSAAIRSTKGRNLGENRTETVDIINALPGVRFTGEGNIIPRSAELNLPFQAIYLRGVIVRIIRIYETNVGQFMQSNDLSGSYGLTSVGRLVARKTIFFEGEESRFRNWQTYAIRLNELIEPEPGAIYRVELSFTRELSAYPCEETVSQRTKEQVWADDELKFKEELAHYEADTYYYYYGETDYDYDAPYGRDNPCSDNYYYNNVKSKNILATDLGLMAFSGKEDEMSVRVHNLLNTLPEKGVHLALHNYQHQVIGTGVTDEQGQAVIALRGKPFYLTASQGEQRSYLRVDAGSALSLSTFDVAGDVVQKGIKGFIYGERGVWRPGDTLHLGFMLNDRLKSLPAGHPVTMELFNPSGQLYLRKTQTRGELGLYAFDMPTEADAPTGAWQAKVETGGTSFTKKLRIETIKPNRLKITLSLPEKPILRDALTLLPLHAEWLQGAVARRLKYQIQTSFTPVTTGFPDFRGYIFDDPSKTFRSEADKLITGTTDETGDALAEARFGTSSPAPGMLRADILTRVYEESGDFSIDGSSVSYSPYTHYAGIRPPQKDGEQLDTGKPYTFDVASVDYLGKPSAAGLQVDVYSLSRYWWWESSTRQLGQYMTDSYLKPRRQFEVKTGTNGRASFSLEMERGDWGTYFVRVKDKNSGHSTGVVCYFDWPGYARSPGGNEALSLLDIRTDKQEYAPGEKIILRFPSAAGSRALICIANGTRTLAFSEHLCQAGETRVELEATPEMQPNAYLYVALLQAYGNKLNDLPVRMYGISPVRVVSPTSRLNPVIASATEFKPESPCIVTVSEKNGRPMAYTLAIVDEGLLDLTHFATPDPWQAFNAREALGVASWDLYNQVLGAYGGRIGQLFSIGGDDMLIRAGKALVNRFRPVVHFEGPFLLKKGEKKRHTTYRMPNYNGRVRVMVVAGDGEAYGYAEQSVGVRKPLMLLGTLPRVTGVGEEMLVPATVFATEEGLGPVRVSIACSGNLSVAGSSSQELNFTRKEEKQALFRIRVKDTPGAAKIILTATGKGETSTYEADIEIRSLSRPLTTLTSVNLGAGETWKDRLRLPGMDGTNSLSLEVSTMPPLNLGFRLAYLLGYPHGCIEQITSKAFPQLYLNDIASLTEKEARSVGATIKEVISRYRSFQTSGGGFSYWPYENNRPADEWGTIYATHFLLEAEAKGYLVPAAMKRNALNNLRKTAREWTARSGTEHAGDERYDMRTQAYRLYVLARGQMPEMGAMNRLKEQKGLRGTGVWLLAAAYAGAGREDVAHEMIPSGNSPLFDTYTYDPYTYGSSFRDLGISLQTLCLLKREQQAAETARKITEVLSSEKWLSTQETAFALIGISSYRNRFSASGGMEFSYTLAGKTERVKADKPVWTATLLREAAAAADLEIRNPGNATLFVRLISQGVPAQGEVAPYANGLSLQVGYTDAGGQAIDVSHLAQGSNFNALIRIKNTGFSPIQHLAISQIIPSGWEILNTRYLGANSAEAPDGIHYQDIRDDRLYSYIDHLSPGSEVGFRVRLTAVYAGTFYLPPLYCESMYDNLIQANTEGKQVVVGE